MADVNTLTLYMPGSSVGIQVWEGSQLHLILVSQGANSIPSAPGQTVRQDPFPQYVHDDEIPDLLEQASLGLNDSVIAGLLGDDSSATRTAVETIVTDSAPPAPDATDSVNGVVRLAGDLGGTASSPTVPGLAGKADIEHTQALAILHAALAARAVTPCRIVFAGSSTTAGSNATMPAKRYTNAFIRWLQRCYPSGVATEVAVAHSFGVTFGTLPTQPGVQGYNIGQASTTSSTYITEAERTLIAAMAPTAIVHTIGANDYAAGVTPATFKSNVQTVIDDLNAKLTGPCVHVLAHSYQRPDVGSPAYPWELYGQALREMAEDNPETVAFIDMSRDYELAGVPGSDPLNLIDTDGVHQTDAGHALMADLLWRPVFRGAPPPTAPYSTRPLLVSDSFDRADSTTTPGTADTGQAWTVLSGTWGIIDNKLYSTTSSSSISIEAGAANVVASARITHGNLAGLMFRVIDNSNRWGIFLGGGSLSVVLYKTDVGVTTIVQTATPTDIVATGQTYDVRVVVDGNLMTAYLDDAPVLTYTFTSAEHTKFGAATKVGFRQTTLAATTRFEDLRVRAV